MYRLTLPLPETTPVYAYCLCDLPVNICSGQKYRSLTKRVDSYLNDGENVKNQSSSSTENLLMYFSKMSPRSLEICD